MNLEYYVRHASTLLTCLYANVINDVKLRLAYHSLWLLSYRMVAILNTSSKFLRVAEQCHLVQITLASAKKYTIREVLIWIQCQPWNLIHRHGH